MKQTREEERLKVEVNLQVLMITTIVADFFPDFHIVV